MARVLVVSRNPAMAMGLSATDYEVADLRPPEFGDWIAGTEHADALILDLENPRLAVAAVTNLRAHAKLAPVLLVSSDRPGWDEPEMRQLPAAAVLPLPISKPALLAALEDLLSEPWAHQTMPPQHAEVTQALQELALDRDDPLTEDDDLAWRIAARHRATAPLAAAELLGTVTADAPNVVESAPRPYPDTAVSHAAPAVEVARDESPAEPAVAAEPALATTTQNVAAPDHPGPAPAPEAVSVEHGYIEPVEREPEGDDARPDVGETAPVVTNTGSTLADSPPLSAVPRTRRSTRSTRLPAGATSTSLREMETLRPAPTAPRSESPGAETNVRSGSGSRRSAGVSVDPAQSPRVEPTDDAAELVRRLSRVVNSLYGVPETAEVVVLDTVERTHADAGALMIPDDGAWRVAAGVGMRPLEHRYELHAESWLVQQVAQAHKGVIIEESDIAREQLQGAPLASWRHLLAAPIPQIEALLLLARRDDPPFDEDDLTILAGLGNEAGPLLGAAVETRTLARTLWEFRDVADLPR